MIDTPPSRRGQRLKLLGMVLSLMLTTAATDAIADFTTPWPKQMTRELASKVVEDSEQHERVAKVLIKGWTDAQLTEALTARLANQTHVIYQPGYAVYIEFTGDDGTVLMWFPGNRNVVHGIWKIVDRNGTPEACYHYLNSHNAVTGEFENTECIDPAQTIAAMGVLAARTGDIYNLRSGNIPYRKETTDIPALPN